MKKVLFGFFVIGVIVTGSFFISSKYQYHKGPDNTTISVQTPSVFSLKEAPLESLRGNLIVNSREVFWQNRVATKSAEVADTITVQQGEKIETDETGSASIEFPKILKLSINNDTSFSVIQTLPVDLVFSLDRGSVKFEKLSTNTTALRVKHLLLKIDGNVDVSLSNNKSLITIKVTNGSAILAYNNLDFETQSFVAVPGKTIIFDDSTRQVVAK